MKAKFQHLLILALVVLAIAGWTSARQAKPQTQWEYKVLSLKTDSKTEGKLNELGAQGWEMVSYQEYISSGTGAGAGTYHLKRQK